MTREEAINTLKEWIERDKKIEYADRLENIEIYKLAIKALEQQSSEDCISRKSVLSTYADWHGYGYNNGFYRLVQHMPSVEPERIINNMVHLCESCKYQYPDCPSKNNDSIFGDGIGNDNICCCNKYECKSSVEPEKCGDCISRQALQEWIKDKTFGDIVVASEHNFDCLPSAEPEQKMGEWIIVEENAEWFEGIKCTVIQCKDCHFIHTIPHGAKMYKFCPKCGAKMEVDTP